MSGELQRAEERGPTVAAGTPQPGSAVAGGSTRRTRRYVHEPTVHAELTPPKHVADPVQLLPGSELLIGRHRSCDLRIPHASLEPRHARLVWPLALSAPQVIDCGSRQGTRIAGVPGRLAPGEPHALSGRSLLHVGPVTIGVELRGDEEAWWNESGVEASFDAGPELRGELSELRDLVRVLRDLERERRTGTLRLGDEAVLVFCLGTIMRAQWGHRQGADAARAIARGEPLGGAPARYAFTRVFELSDEPPLDLWPSELTRGGSRRLRQAIERVTLAADDLSGGTARIMRHLTTGLTRAQPPLEERTVLVEERRAGVLPAGPVATG